MRRENWFKHDIQSRMDLKMNAFVYSYGMEGYGLFWFLVEQLYYERSHRIAIATEALHPFANLSTGGLNRIREIIDGAIAAGLFQSDGQYFWSDRVMREIEDEDERNQDISEKRSAAGKEGNRKRWQDVANGSQKSQTVARERERETDEREEKDLERPPVPDLKTKIPEGGSRAHSINLPRGFDTPRVKDALTRWNKHRQKLKLPFDEMALEALVLQWTHDPAGFIRSVNASIANGWKTIQPQKTPEPRHAPGAQTTPAEASAVLKHLHDQGVPVPIRGAK